jgi:hypothetical protein
MGKWTQSSKLSMQDKIVLVKHEAKNEQVKLHIIWLTVLILSCVAIFLTK